MSLPVDFEQRVKMAASPTGAGSPVQISAKDLMDNFNYLDLKLKDDKARDGDMLMWSGNGWHLIRPLPQSEPQLLVLSEGQHYYIDVPPEVTEVSVIVIDNGVFKTGQFHITGTLTAI